MGSIDLQHHAGRRASCEFNFIPIGQSGGASPRRRAGARGRFDLVWVGDQGRSPGAANFLSLTNLVERVPSSF
jgi:hypothetical protein